MQAKRYADSQRIGTPVVQTLLGSVQIHNAHHGVIVTTTKFSKPAVDLARKYNVELIDGTRLAVLAQSMAPSAPTPEPAGLTVPLQALPPPPPPPIGVLPGAATARQAMPLLRGDPRPPPTYRPRLVWRDGHWREP